MKNITNVMTLSLLALILISCPEDDNPTNGGNGIDFSTYFSTSSGSFWIYEHKEIDYDSKSQTGETTYDSTAVTGIEEKTGKQATVFTSWDYDNAGGASNPTDLYYYEENESVYAHADLFNRALAQIELPVDIPLDIGDQWLKIADNQSNSWITTSVTIEDVEISFQGIPGLFGGQILVEGTKAGSEKITLSGSEINTIKFAHTITLSGELKSLEGITLLTLSPISTNFNLWFGENAGIVKTELESFLASIPLLGEQKINGEKITAIRFNYTE